MINWQETKKKYGYGEQDRLSKKLPIIANCDVCGIELETTKQRHYQYVHRAGMFRCKQCGKEAMCNAVSAKIKDKWQDEEYISKQCGRRHSNELKEQARIRAINNWNDTEYIRKFKAGFDADKARNNLDLYRNKATEAISKKLVKCWEDPNYRLKMVEQSKCNWANDEYKIKVINSLRNHYADDEIKKSYSIAARVRWQSSRYRHNWLKSFIESLTDERRAEISLNSCNNWAKQEYRDKIEANWDNDKKEWMSNICKEWWGDNKRKEVADLMIDRWQDEEFRNKYIAAFRESWTDERRKKARESWTDERRKKARESWTDERRKKASATARKLWEDQDYVAKMLKIGTRPSSLELQFKAILDDFGIDYEQQFHVGPYLFDFKIDNSLVEIQGDYWHTLPKNISKDKAKATYIEKYFPEYKLLYLWEHEFYELEKVRYFIQANFGSIDLIDFEFNDLIFDDSVSYGEARGLFENYHYKGSIGRSGSIYGVRLNNKLIAAGIITNPTRNIDGGELTRFVIHPGYNKKNLGSWFMSRMIKNAMIKYDRLITFADPNFNHYGGLYLASNWKFVGETKSDYWYVSMDGWVMHKKTLWNRAKNMCMKESEYSDAFGYIKVWGLPKKKFEYCRK